jgi:hypothetical protein
VVHNLRAILERLGRHGHLVPEDINEVIFIHGHWPVASAIATDATAYTIYVLNLACTPGVTPETPDAALEPARRPEALRGLARDQILPPDPRWCAERLAAMIKAKKAEYARRARKLHRKVDVPEVLRELDRAAVLKYAALGRYNRCHAESGITFDRAHTALRQALERDAEEAEDEDQGQCSGCDGRDEKEASAPSTPKPGPPLRTASTEEARSGLPNERGNAPDGQPQVSEEVTRCADESGAQKCAPNTVSGVSVGVPERGQEAARGVSIPTPWIYRAAGPSRMPVAARLEDRTGFAPGDPARRPGRAWAAGQLGPGRTTALPRVTTARGG